ncbi:MAG: RnfABCDGE type electron transport complex subunit D [Lysobacterales bacterium]|jgi:Na+-transporting NADH:ubiquinone oxidoreductase subunit B
MKQLFAQVLENAAILARRFILSSHTVTRAPPYIRDANNVQRLWNYFVIASVPSWLIGLWSLGHQTNLAIASLALDPAPGWRAALLVKTGVGLDAFDMMACVAHGALYFLPIFIVALLVGGFWESLFAAVRKKRVDEGLLYIAWFVALMMPADAPLYQVAHGMSFGMVFGKLIYGGSGRYLVNPAMLGIAFLVFSYSELMFSRGAWVPVSGWDQPTLLELVTEEGGIKVITAVDYSWWQLFLGDRPGAVGVVSVLGAAVGAIFLILTGMASWRVIAGSLLGVIGVSLLGSVIAPDHLILSIPWYWHVVLGGFAFGTVFIATDPVTGAMTDPGRWGFGLLVGGLTVVIRLGNISYYEAMIFAILLASLFSPLIDHVVVRMNIRRRLLRLREADDA